MKTFGIIHILLFLILMLAYQCTHAQDLLVTTKGDSVRGEIKPILYGADKKVQIITADRKKTLYNLVQVKSYTYKGDTYQPVKGPAGYTFMKLIRAGYLSLYAFQLENQMTFDGQYLVKLDGGRMEVPNLNFKKSMKSFLSDCPTVVDRIDRGELSKREVDQIVADYNTCIAGKTVDHERIIAEKAVATKKIGAWDVLEDKVKNLPDFGEKSNALDMIAEIKKKIGKSEKVPNFLVEGLKQALPQADLKEDLSKALQELQ